MTIVNYPALKRFYYTMEQRFWLAAVKSTSGAPFILTNTRVVQQICRKICLRALDAEYRETHYRLSLSEKK